MLSKSEIALLRLAEARSRCSPDRTQIGAVVADDNQHLMSWGFNRFPYTLAKNFINYDEKNRYVIHAELEALRNFPTEIGPNSTMLIWGLAPCAACAGLIADYGVRRCVAVVAAKSTNKEQWEKEAELSKRIFESSDIWYEQYTLEEFTEVETVMSALETKYAS